MSRSPLYLLCESCLGVQLLDAEENNIGAEVCATCHTDAYFRVVAWPEVRWQRRRLTWLKHHAHGAEAP